MFKENKILNEKVYNEKLHNNMHPKPLLGGLALQVL